MHDDDNGTIQDNLQNIPVLNSKHVHHATYKSINLPQNSVLVSAMKQLAATAVRSAPKCQRSRKSRKLEVKKIIKRRRNATTPEEISDNTLPGQQVEQIGQQNEAQGISRRRSTRLGQQAAVQYFPPMHPR